MKYLSLKDHVYNYISEKINAGTLHTDDKLSEIQISEELNVSRTPVREALIQLAADGYIEDIPRKGFRVKEVDGKTAAEIYNIIGPLDGRAAYLAVDNLTDEDIAEMEFLLLTMDSAIEKSMFLKYYDMQMKFHDIYIQKCGNQHLIDLIEKIKKIFIRKMYALDENKTMKEILHDTNAEHYKMVEYFKAKDKNAIQSYLRDVHWCSEKAKFATLHE